MMSFKTWRKWYKAQSWHFKWFILLVIFRPIIDNFYYLKEISPLISPSYIVGILTPLLIVLSFISFNFNSKIRSPIFDFLVGLWGAFVIFNVGVYLLNDPSMSILGDSIRYITPVFLFFYLRHMIKSKPDIYGLLKAFMISLIFPAAFFFLEMIFGGFRPEYLSAGRGGGARIQGAYADTMNYSVYIIGALLIGCYLFLKKQKARKSKTNDYLSLGLILMFALGGLISIKHVSTWAASSALIVVFAFFAITKKETLLVVVLLMPIFLFAGKVIYQEQVSKLVEKEVKVIEGDSDIDRSFNGRMSRWRKYFERWGDMPLVAVFIGVPITGFDEVPAMLSGGMHSDYVRVLFLTGVIGLILYLGVFLLLAIKAQRFPGPEKFLIIATVTVVLLHSISTTPLLYTSYIYLILSIFAFASLPNRLVRA